MTSLQNATDKEEGSTVMGSETVYDPLHERVFIWTLGGPVMVGRFAQRSANNYSRLTGLFRLWLCGYNRKPDQR